MTVVNSDPVIPQPAKFDYAKIHSALASKALAYQHRVEELKGALIESSVSVEERKKYRSTAIAELALDVASDFSLLAQYQMTSPSSYADKTIAPFIQYLRDLRYTLSLLQTVDEL